MQIIIASDYADMSRKAADVIAAQVKNKPSDSPDVFLEKFAEFRHRCGVNAPLRTDCQLASVFCRFDFNFSDSFTVSFLQSEYSGRFYFHS